jgi:hypothetical protein
MAPDMTTATGLISSGALVNAIGGPALPRVSA